MKKIGRKEIPPKLEPLTVTVHVGADEEIIGMANVEVEDIEGCVSLMMIILARRVTPSAHWQHYDPSWMMDHITNMDFLMMFESKVACNHGLVAMVLNTIHLY